MRTFHYAAGLLALALAGCHSQTGAPGAEGSSAMPGDADDHSPYTGIGEGEMVSFTGTEPFWGGKVRGTALTYSTPETPDGNDIAVTRFAGRGGVSWNGMFDGARFALAITPGKCSDGMSDRTYPFVATLDVKGEQRQGCGWTESHGFTQPDPAETPPE